MQPPLSGSNTDYMCEAQLMAMGLYTKCQSVWNVSATKHLWRTECSSYVSDITSTELLSSSSLGGERDELDKWDKQIYTICLAVNQNLYKVHTETTVGARFNIWEKMALTFISGISINEVGTIINDLIT